MSNADNSLGTVSRVVQMLRYMAEHPETTIRDTAAALSLAPSTCHRLFDLLTREGIVEHNKAQRNYRIGAEYFRIAALVQSHSDLRRLAIPFMRRVVDACDETCVLCIYLPSSRKLIYAEKVDSSRMLRYQVNMNTPLSAFWGASARGMLAYMPEEEIAEIHASESNAPGSGEAVPDRATLDRELAEVRARGYAVSRGQKVVGAVGINAPVFDADGRAVASLGVTVPEIRVGPIDLDRLGTLVKSVADELSIALGGNPSKQQARRTQ